MDLANVRAAIGEKTRAVLAVHVYEYCCEMEEIEKIVEESGFGERIAIVEDMAELIGGERNGKKCGSFGTD